MLDRSKIVAATASQWQAQLESGEVTSEELCWWCLDQIRREDNARLNAVINTALPQAVERQARQLDEERKSGHVRSPLHGIPIIVKDVFPMVVELGLPCTAGAVALADSYGIQNCSLVERILSAGLIVIGTANLTEFCGIKADLPLGWSALGKQTQSPYIPNGVSEHEAPCGNSMIGGSSSGSASSVAAGLAPLSIGQETTGSLVIPANRGALYSLKISPARAPRQGAFCLSREHDSLGGMAKSAGDLKELTNIILGNHSTSEPRSDRTFRIGLVNPSVWQYPDWMCPLTKALRSELKQRLQKLARTLDTSGVYVAGEVDLPDEDDLEYDGQGVIRYVAFSQFRENFEMFTAGLNSCIKTLKDLIDYNYEHPALAMPHPHASQAFLIDAHENQTKPEDTFLAFSRCRSIAQARIDEAMQRGNVDLLLGPGDSGLYDLAACAGYPIGTMPLGEIEYQEGHFRPEGVSILAREGCEELMLDFMLRYEEIVDKRPEPRHLCAIMQN